MEPDKKYREMVSLIAAASSRVVRNSSNDEFRGDMFDQIQANNSADVQEYLQQTLLARMESRNKRPRLAVLSQNIRVKDNASTTTATNRQRKIPRANLENSYITEKEGKSQIETVKF